MLILFWLGLSLSGPISFQPDELVYDQHVPFYVGIPSFLTPTWVSVIADDFPIYETTEISRVRVFGGAHSTPGNFELRIFNDQGGLPGSQRLTRMVTQKDYQDGNLTLEFSINATLEPGVYWLCVFEVAGESVWYWHGLTQLQFGKTFHFGNDFLNWTPQGDDVDLSFEIYGNVADQPPANVLSFPSFLSAANFYNDSRNNLFCQFPDPNADGSYRGSDHLAWEVTFLQDCSIIGGPVLIDPGQFPFGVSVNHPTPDPYLIECRRVIVSSDTKKGGSSPPYVQPGPNGSVLNEFFPRIVNHVPKISGGFKGVLSVANTNQDDVASYFIVAFDEQGNELGSRAESLGKGERKTYALYSTPANLSVNAVIFPSLQDRISYLEVRERLSDLTEVSFTYYSTATGFPAETKAAKILRGDVLGSEFSIQGGSPNANYWDGFAVLNRSDFPAQLYLEKYNSADQYLGQRFLGNLQPNHKWIGLGSDLVGFTPYANYILKSANGAQLLVLGLSGTHDKQFFAASNVQRKR
ncbi:MAG: hypothetical protein H6510_07655 [Acidobacteria bacterium]|nr:hypothetical protein [Acidobacteriota bacterium]